MQRLVGSGEVAAGDAPTGYVEYLGENCYDGFGGHAIDSSPVSGLSVAQCTKRCDDDATCDCVVTEGEGGNCWKRSDCLPSAFDKSAAAVRLVLTSIDRRMCAHPRTPHRHSGHTPSTSRKTAPSHHLRRPAAPSPT